jgi:hypothetical protein
MGSDAREEVTASARQGAPASRPTWLSAPERTSEDRGHSVRVVVVFGELTGCTASRCSGDRYFVNSSMRSIGPFQAFTVTLTCIGMRSSKSTLAVDGQIWADTPARSLRFHGRLFGVEMPSMSISHISATTVMQMSCWYNEVSAIIRSDVHSPMPTPIESPLASGRSAPIRERAHG